MNSSLHIPVPVTDKGLCRDMSTEGLIYIHWGGIFDMSRELEEIFSGHLPPKSIDFGEACWFLL